MKFFYLFLHTLIWKFIAIFISKDYNYPLCDTHSAGAVVCVSVTECVCVQGRVSSLSFLSIYGVRVVVRVSVEREREIERAVLGVVVLGAWAGWCFLS